MYVYYSVKRLNESNMAIYKALLKYGHSNFRFEILEYCEPENAIFREQDYIDLLKPEYNINPIAGSSLGYKHNQETLDKFKCRKYSDESRAKLSAAATGRKLSEDTKAKLSANRIGTKLPDKTRAKISATTAANIGVAVIVKNIKTGETLEYKTMTEAGAALNVSRTTIKNYIKSGKIFRECYIFCNK
jgi:group I intron endonuclease